MVAAILFIIFFGFNNEESHSLLIFIFVYGGDFYFVPDFVLNGYPLPPIIISRGILKKNIYFIFSLYIYFFFNFWRG